MIDGSLTPGKLTSAIYDAQSGDASLGDLSARPTEGGAHGGQAFSAPQRDASLDIPLHLCHISISKKLLSHELWINDRPVPEITSTRGIEIGIRASSEFRRTHLIPIIPLETEIIRYD